MIWSLIQVKTKTCLTVSIEMGRVMGKPTFCICLNQGTDQLCSNCEADQAHWFSLQNSTILLLNLKFPASSHLLCFYSSVFVTPVALKRNVFSESSGL